jgi:hypothetical protein
MSVIPLSSTSPSAASILLGLDTFSGRTEHESLIPSDLSSVSARELRVLCNQLHRALDVDFPPFGARENYVAVVNQLEEREVWARRKPELHRDR